MRALVQRVSRAAVRVDGEQIAAIGPGLLVLLGVSVQDEVRDADWIAAKLAGLRVFENPPGQLNESVRDVGGAILVVSQFTLYADTRKGRRPSFTGAAGAEKANTLYERVIERLDALGIPVRKGLFGAHMEVELVNDGPVTILVESP